MIGRTYLLRGEPVTVLIAYRLPSKTNPLPPDPPGMLWHRPPAGAPRNVLIEYADGHREVRPFRGLRRAREVTTP